MYGLATWRAYIHLSIAVLTHRHPGLSTAVYPGASVDSGLPDSDSLNSQKRYNGPQYRRGCCTTSSRLLSVESLYLANTRPFISRFLCWDYMPIVRRTGAAFSGRPASQCHDAITGRGQQRGHHRTAHVSQMHVELWPQSNSEECTTSYPWRHRWMRKSGSQGGRLHRDFYRSPKYGRLNGYRWRWSTSTEKDEKCALEAGYLHCLTLDLWLQVLEHTASTIRQKKKEHEKQLGEVEEELTALQRSFAIKAMDISKQLATNRTEPISTKADVAKVRTELQQSYREKNTMREQLRTANDISRTSRRQSQSRRRASNRRRTQWASNWRRLMKQSRISIRQSFILVTTPFPSLILHNYDCPCPTAAMATSLRAGCKWLVDNKIRTFELCS